MKVPLILGMVAGASLALGSIANADLVDNGDGTLTYFNTFDNDEVVGDGNIYGAADVYVEHAGAEIVAIWWSDLVVDTGNPFSAYSGDNFWALWLMNGGGGEGWYYGVPFAGESNSILGPSSAGYNVAGAGYTILADGSMGTGYADVGGSEALNAYVSGSINITFVGEIIPTPGAIALIGLAGLAGKSRRRR